MSLILMKFDRFVPFIDLRNDTKKKFSISNGLGFAVCLSFCNFMVFSIINDKFLNLIVNNE